MHVRSVYYHLAGGSSGSLGAVQAGHFLWHSSQLLPVLCKPLRRHLNIQKTDSCQWILGFDFAALRRRDLFAHTEADWCVCVCVCAWTLPVAATEASSCACKGLDVAPGSVCTSSWLSSGSGRELAAPCTRCPHGPGGQCWNDAQACHTREKSWTKANQPSWKCLLHFLRENMTNNLNTCSVSVAKFWGCLFLPQTSEASESNPDISETPTSSKSRNNTEPCLHWKYAKRKAAYLGIFHQSLLF